MKIQIEIIQIFSNSLLKTVWTTSSLYSWLFTNGPRDWGSIPGQVIPKTQKMVRDAVLLSIQYYKVRIKGKVEQSREWSSALPSVVATEKGAFRSPSTEVTNFTFYWLIYSLAIPQEFFFFWPRITPNSGWRLLLTGYQPCDNQISLII